jgi:hypothetical protein
MIVARIGEKRYSYRILVKNQKKRTHWEDVDVGGRLMLEWTYEK